MKNENENLKIRRKNRIAYIAEAGLEYFISLLVTGAFLAALLKHIGISDALTGITTSLASLGFLAQAAVIFIHPKRSLKTPVTVMHLINQLLFAALYMIPFTSIPQSVKAALFVVMFLGGHLLSNTVMPFKLSWLMSFVDDRKRGEFTANKEIVSLIGGMVFSYVMGAVVDCYEGMGKAETGFVLCGITLFVLTMLHLWSLVSVRDTEESLSVCGGGCGTVREVMENTVLNKSFRKVIVLDALWQMGTGISVSYFGVYQIRELGFSLRFVAVLSAVYSIVRVLFSRMFGKFADKYSWPRMMLVSFAVGAAGFFINAFTVPANGKILFTVYYIFYAVYMAGSNSGIMNLAFDYVSPENRAGALGVKSAIGGLAGFSVSLVGGLIVHAVQNRGNLIFGHTVYAQQILSFLTFLIYVTAMIYIKKSIFKIKKEEI